MAYLEKSDLNFAFDEIVTFRDILNNILEVNSVYYYKGFEFETYNRYYNTNSTLSDADHLRFAVPLSSHSSNYYVYHVDFLDATLSIRYKIFVDDSSNNNDEDDCSFSYRFYKIHFTGLNDTPLYWMYLSITKDGVEVHNERIYREQIEYNSSTYANSVMQPYIDACIANRKIKTTCCLLACCEPDKYILI